MESLFPIVTVIATGITLLIGGYENAFRFYVFFGEEVEANIVYKHNAPRHVGYMLEVEYQYNKQNYVVNKVYGTALNPRNDINLGKCKVFFSNPRLFGCENAKNAWMDVSVWVVLLMVLFTTLAQSNLRRVIAQDKKVMLDSSFNIDEALKSLDILLVYYYALVVSILTITSFLIA